MAITERVDKDNYTIVRTGDSNKVWQFSMWIRAENKQYRQSLRKCVAFLNIDLEAVGNWAERNNINYASYQELASNNQVTEIMKQHVEEVNKALAQDSVMTGCQVSRFLILHKELDPDDGEITRTRKVRRSFVSDKYKDLVDALYNGSKQVSTRTEVTYEDGKKGYLEATINIVESQIFVLKSNKNAA